MSDLLFCLQGRNPSDWARLRTWSRRQGLRKGTAFWEASLPGHGGEWEKWGGLYGEKVGHCHL